MLVVAGTWDMLIPSEAEAAALPRLLPHARAALLRNRSHAAMLEAGVDVAALCREQGFYVPSRALTGDGARRARRTPGVGVIGRCALPRMARMRWSR